MARKGKPVTPDEKPRAPALMCATAGCPRDAMIRHGTWHTRQVEGRKVRVQGAPWTDRCFECHDRLELAAIRAEMGVTH